MFKVIGTGHYVPENVVTNKDLEKIVDTTDQWIVERTGIKERRVVSNNELNSDMAAKAALNALKKASRNPKDIEILIVGTSTPDYTLPAMAPIVQHKLGCDLIPAFDLNSVCSSFAYAFLIGAGFLTSGYYKNCMIIGSDVYSRILNWEDRTTCCIFGDGAGAVFIEKDLNAKGILSYNYGAKGEDADLIRIPVGGTKHPIAKANNYSKKDFYFQMAGTDVYEFTITTIPNVVTDLLEKSNLKPTEIDWVVLHQANRRIIESVAKKTEIPLDKFIINIDRFGNTSSASIPIALDEGVEHGKIKRKDKVMFIGFGGGLSWGGVIIEW